MTAHFTQRSETPHRPSWLLLISCLALGCASQMDEDASADGFGNASGPVPSGANTIPVGSSPSGIAGSGAQAPIGTGDTGTTPAAMDPSTGDPVANAGDPGSAIDDLMPPAGETLTPARCGGDASQTIIIGDSYIALSGDFPRLVQEYAGQTYRLHAVSGTAMVGGLPPSIPDQYRLSLAGGPVETIVMDGGGNDVLLGDPSCRTTGPTGPMPGSMCAMTIERAVQGAADLFAEAAANGVREVVYFLYPHLAGLNINLNPSLDYAYPLFQEMCANAPLDCKLVDTRAAFEGHPEYLGIDGIHPTLFGSEVIAKMTWEVMGFNCENGVAVQ